MTAPILIGLVAIINIIGALLSNKGYDKLAYALFSTGLFFIFLSLGVNL